MNVDARHHHFVRTSERKAAMARTTTAEARRRDLIEAILKILATEGWDRLTVRRVSAESHVSPGAMPHFLGTKAEMVTEAIRHGFRTYQERIQGAVSQASTPDARLDQWLSATVSDTADTDDEWGFWLCMWGRIPFDEAIRRDLAPVYRVHAATVRQIILDGIASGVFSPVLDARTVGDQLVALIDGLMMRCRLDPEMTPERVQASVAGFVDAVVVRDGSSRRKRTRSTSNGTAPSR